MNKCCRRQLSPTVTPLSPTSPKWLDETDQSDFFSEPDEISEFSEKIEEVVPTLAAQPRRRDAKWLRSIREVVSELRSIFKAKHIGIPMDALPRCIRSDESADSDANDAAAEIALLCQQEVQPRLLWSEDKWYRETTGLLYKLLEILGRKQVGMAMNSFLDFISIYNSMKVNYEKVLSGHLEKIRNQLLVRTSPHAVPYDVFLGDAPLETSVQLARSISSASSTLGSF